MSHQPRYQLNCTIGANRYARFTYILLGLFFSLSLISCDSSSSGDQAVEPEVILILNDKNIDQFTITLAKDYLTTLNSLIKEFHIYRKAGDSFGFTRFRNHNWTPKYIERKNHYHAIQQQNSIYIAKQPIAPLFDAFENIIFHGVSLKNALLDDDKMLMKKTLLAIESDKKMVINVARSIGK